MATKSEWFRYWKERSGPKRKKKPSRPQRDAKVDTAKPGVSASDRRAPVTRESASAGKKATYVLEDTSTRPSRKSTRKASNRQKTDTKMRELRRTAQSRPRS